MFQSTLIWHWKYFNSVSRCVPVIRLVLIKLLLIGCCSHAVSVDERWGTCENGVPIVAQIPEYAFSRHWKAITTCRLVHWSTNNRLRALCKMLLLYNVRMGSSWFVADSTSFAVLNHLGEITCQLNAQYVWDYQLFRQSRTSESRLSSICLFKCETGRVLWEARAIHFF